MKGSVIRARVDHLLKAQASAVLASCGLEMSDALQLFCAKSSIGVGCHFRCVRLRATPPPRRSNKLDLMRILEMNQPLVEVALARCP